MKKVTIVIPRSKLHEICALHYKIRPEQITYVGWSGIFNFGEFRIEYNDDE